MPFPLAGKTALVTGGARGIGLAAARALAGLGASVTFTARSPASLAALEGTANGVLCDITNRARLAEVTAPCLLYTSPSPRD